MNKNTLSLYLVISSLLLTVSVLFGQKPTGIASNGTTAPKWTVNEPYEQKVFIENNEGQLNGKIPAENGKILFSTRITGVDVYFSPTGVTYRYDKFPKAKSDEEDKEDAKPETSYFSVQWENSNPNVELLAEDEVSFYYCYSKGNKHTVFAHAFKKILYKNLYTGIDIEYSFPSTAKGLEYSIIVHPGADLAQVKLLYKDANAITMNSTGDVVMQSSFGEFSDHFPSNVYYQRDNEKSSAYFKRNGNEISFGTVINRSKTLVIDPWVTNPSFTGYDAGYDIHYDLKGNVYVYGSFNPYQEIKLDSAGAIKWIFNAIYPNTYSQFGGFAVDEVSGTSYLGCATDPVILKVNTLGIQVDSFALGTNMEELWRMAYNKCVGSLIIGGGGTSDPNQICLLDTSFTTLKSFDILGAGEGQHDIALLAIDNTNASVYVAIMESNRYSDYNNVLVNCLLPNITTKYIVSDNFSFYEGLPGLSYIDGTNGNSGSPNGAVAGSKWLYLYDGATLRRYNKNTGTNTLSKTINATKMNWSGIDMDLCENLYIADNTLINIYDTGLNNIGTINPTQPIYDLHIIPGNQLIACGKQFISCFTLPNTINLVINKSGSNACTGGVATAKLNTCSVDSSNYSYLWSNGATTQTVTGLTPGNYSVIINPRCDFSFEDTFSIDSGLSSLLLLSGNTNIACGLVDTGSVSVNVLNENPPFTYNWSNGATTKIVNGLSIGTYSVIVTDSCGNSGTVSVRIPDTATFVLSFSQININCFGDNNGVATLKVSGGTSPYTYWWSPTGKTTASISGLTAGTYTVSIKDSNGCSITSSVTITQPSSLLNVSLPSFTYSCPINCTWVTAIASGGTPPYTFYWPYPLSISGASVCLGYNSGNYVVDVTDANGCTANINTYVEILSSIATITTNVKCNGGNNGSAYVTAYNGSGYYSYSWSPIVCTNTMATGLSAGSYTVTVFDTYNNCSCSSFLTITQPQAISIVNSITPTTCNGSSVSAIVSGGTAPYTYKWSNNNTSSSISGLFAGTYTLNITDHNGCKDSSIITITQPIVVIVSLNIASNISCNGGNNGEISSIVGGGISPFTYLWSNGETTSSISGLTIGTYTCNVIDSNGCMGSKSITLTQPSELNVTANTTANTNCYGSNTGIATANGTGGSLPYTYSWSNSGGTNAIATGLSAGNYTVTVYDSCGNSSTASVSITAPTSTISFSQENVVQNWTIPNGVSQITITASGAAGGGIRIGDYGGPGAVLSGVVPVIPGDKISIVVGGIGGTSTKDDGGGGGGGSYLYDSNSINLLIVAAGGGGEGYTNPGGNGGINLLTNATANGTGGNGAGGISGSGGAAGTTSCTYYGGASGAGWVSNGAPGTGSLYPDFGGYDRVNHFAGGAAQSGDANKGGFGGGAGGGFDGGGGGGGYNGGGGGNELCSSGGGGGGGGSYLNGTLIGTPVANNTGNGKVIISFQAIFSTLITINNLSCNGGNNASISSTVIGGVSPYTYSWSNNQSTQNISGLSAGTYTLNVADINGCICSDSVIITEPPVLHVNVSATSNEKCISDTDGSAVSVISGGTYPYKYSWSNSETTSFVSSLSVGTYTLNVTDSNGCTGWAIFNITEPFPLQVMTNISSVLSCHGDSNGIASATINGGTSPYTYLWTDGNTNSTISGLSAGIYSVSVMDSCGNNTTASVNITQPALLKDSIQRQTICVGDTAILYDVSTGGTYPYSYLWNTGGTSNSITVSPIITSKYILTVTDLNGCVSKDSSIVKVNPAPVLTLIFQSKDTVCNSAGDVTLFTGPPGGTLSGSSVYGNFFYPDSAKTGAYNVIYYSYTDSNGCFAVVADSIYVDNCTGINEITGTNGGITVYPNPSNGVFTIQLSGVSSQWSVEVYDVLGQKVYSAMQKPMKQVQGGQVQHDEQIDLRSKSAGVYFYRATKENGGLLGEGKIIIEK